ncbi:SDR family NAD(P)-dependent oxidoreductase [Rhizobium binxianense]
MDLELQGKRALITGGSRGIGKAVARVLTEEGAHVALLARDGDRLSAAASEITAATDRRVAWVTGDTTQDGSLKDAITEAARLLGGDIDILVNAAAEPAGYSKPPGLAAIEAETLLSEINTKVMGYIRCAQAVVPGMKARGWGRIVNISGQAALTTGSAIGSIRNIGVAALTKNLADELGPFGINVTVVHPGITRTERTATRVAERAASSGCTPEAVEAQIASTNSINHLIDASEIAHIVAFLCSPKSRAINGDAIAAGGGLPGVIRY